ncbi:hypothetical protein Aph02nite_52520 [Actinoplanes philippinensis]|uniref:Ig-like domain-containing protein n=1 Tax=Actinoplanes philippinensis TaxID=35752 RepID=A0A1I2IIR2_9ACTN|nr:hypothetical protein [Actinoplanes philippinensis]GIE79302.1 hypothetical protein Aph02nite_52520 [Actinoplanes philippinensis]SFF42242.1 hypothetical protein SAMN05421541_110106 [Actinoplanes philippinensis]
MLFIKKASALFGSSVAAAAALLIGDPSAASAAENTHFVPEATTIKWNGTTATVTFLEVAVELDANVTTISTRVTAEVDAVCTNDESTLTIHRTASSLRANDYLISFDGTVPGTAKVPLRVQGLNVSGYTCVVEHIAMTAELEDFWTGATLTHKA